MYDQAIAAVKAGRWAEALSHLDSIVDTRDLDETVARARLQRGLVLEAIGEQSQSVADYEVLVRLVGAPDPALREIGAWAAHHYGTVLHALGRTEDARNTLSLLAEPAVSTDTIEVRRLRSAAFVSLGSIYETIGDDRQVVALAEKTVSAFAEESDSVVRLNVTRARAQKALALHRVEGTQSSIVAYDELLAWIFAGSALDDDLLDQAAWGLANKSGLLIDAGRYAEAIDAANEVRARIHAAADDNRSIRAARATAWLNQARASDALDRKDDELRAYEEAVRLTEDFEDPRLQELASTARVSRAACLRELGRHHEAIGEYAEVAKKYDASAGILGENAARALYYQAELLAEIGEHAMSINTFDDLITRFGGRGDPGISAIVESARESRTALIAEAN